MSVAVEEARERVSKYLDAFSALDDKGNQIHGVIAGDGDVRDLLASDLELLVAASAEAIDHVGMLDRFSKHIVRWENANQRQKQSIEFLLEERDRLNRLIQERNARG